MIGDAHNITVAHDNNGINTTGLMSNEGDFEVCGFRMTRSVAGSNATKSLAYQNAFGGASWQVHHMFFDGGGLAGNGIGYRSQADTRQAWSCLIWDCSGDGLYYDGGTGSFDCENVSIRNCGDGASVGGNSEVFNNNASFSNTVDFNLSAAGSTTGDNNASTDATADDWNTQSDNNINLTETDQVESTTDTDSDFMHPK